jgi:hypothetical protein
MVLWWRFCEVGTAHCVGISPPAMLPTPALMQRARARSVEARALSRCEWRPATLTSSMNLEARVALRAHSCHGFTLSFLTHVSLCWGSAMHSRHRRPIHAVRRALLSVGQIRCDDGVILLLRCVNLRMFLLFLDQRVRARLVARAITSCDPRSASRAVGS